MSLAVAWEATARTYEVVAPETLPSGPVPLVVVLHGGFGAGRGAIAHGRWRDAAHRHGFLVVAPDGLGRSWNAGICCGLAMRRNVDDVGFVRAVIDDVASRWSMASERVYVTGISNGGMMAYRLGCEASDVFAALAPVASTLGLPGGAPSRPISVLHIHGLADANVPLEGGHPTKAFQRDPPDYPPVRRGLEVFARAAGCTAEPVATTAGSVSTMTWPCAPPVAVELITIADAGHAWPGGERMARILGPPSTALDATETIWHFFASHRRG